MANYLSDLISAWAEVDPKSEEGISASLSITNANPSGEDFTDAVFDMLNRDRRMVAYAMLLMWCKKDAPAIWKRRINTEADQSCRAMLTKLLHRFHSYP